MSERSHESVLLEAEYWRSILEELRTLEGLYPRAADELVRSVTHAVALTRYSFPPGGAESLELVVRHASEAMAAVRTMQEQSGAIGRLIDGRLIALYREAGLTMDVSE